MRIVSILKCTFLKGFVLENTFFSSPWAVKACPAATDWDPVESSPLQSLRSGRWTKQVDGTRPVLFSISSSREHHLARVHAECTAPTPSAEFNIAVQREPIAKPAWSECYLLMIVRVILPVRCVERDRQGWRGWFMECQKSNCRPEHWQWGEKCWLCNEGTMILRPLKWVNYDNEWVVE